MAGTVRAAPRMSGGRARRSLHSGIRPWCDSRHPQPVSHITGRDGPGWDGLRYRPGNQSSISRSADSGESDPCTRLSWVTSARSPRMVPGAAFSTGSVPPASCRKAAMARGPSTIAATTGPDVMNSSSDRRTACRRVRRNACGPVRRRRSASPGPRSQAFALDAADDLADQAALDAVGLDQYQGPLSHGRQRTCGPSYLKPPVPGRDDQDRVRGRRLRSFSGVVHRAGRGSGSCRRALVVRRDQSGGGCCPGSRPRSSRRFTSLRRYAINSHTAAKTRPMKPTAPDTTHPPISTSWIRQIDPDRPRPALQSGQQDQEDSHPDQVAAGDRRSTRRRQSRPPAAQAAPRSPPGSACPPSPRGSSSTGRARQACRLWSLIRDPVRTGCEPRRR